MATKRAPFYDPLKTFLFVLKKENFFLILGITLIILFCGAFALYFFEHQVNKTVETLGDSLYWAVISMTTTGYGDITPTTTGGRVVAVIVVLSGLFLLSTVTATFASVFVAKKIREGKGLETIKLKGHILLCGWNRNAAETIDSLLRLLPAKDLKLVLVNELAEEEGESLRFKYRDHDFKILRGDFTREDVLVRANIRGAQSAILLADTSGPHSLQTADERTILGTLAIKSLAPEVKTCAELLNPENRQHLKRANVDEIVVRGEHIGSLLAGATASPGLPRVFSSLLSPEEENSLWKVAIPSNFVGQRVGALTNHFREKHHAIFIGLLKEQKGLALENILTDDYSAIDQFIKQKFEEAGQDYPGKKEAMAVLLNPPEDTVLTEEHAAVVIARHRP